MLTKWDQCWYMPTDGGVYGWTWQTLFALRDYENAPKNYKPNVVIAAFWSNSSTSAKSTAEQLGISRERVGSIIHEDLDMRKLSTKWVPKCLNADQKRQRCQSSEQLPEFFSARSKWFSVAIGDHGRNLVISVWPGDKATINGVGA